MVVLVCLGGLLNHRRLSGFELKPSPEPFVEGTGLGLNLARRIVVGYA
jgi:hypothetical protein